MQKKTLDPHKVAATIPEHRFLCIRFKGLRKTTVHIFNVLLCYRFYQVVLKMQISQLFSGLEATE